MPELLAKAELISQLQQQAAALGMTPSAVGDHGFSAAREAITSKWWLGGRKVVYRMACGLTDDHTVHYREAVIETSWGIPPPTLSVETTVQRGTKLSGQRHDVSPGGGGTLDYSETRRAFEQCVTAAGWSFRFEPGRMP
jgi:hypothetical protein